MRRANEFARQLGITIKRARGKLNYHIYYYPPKGCPLRPYNIRPTDTGVDKTFRGWLKSVERWVLANP